MKFVRGCVLASLVTVGLTLGTAGSASAASTATVGTVTCNAQQGSVDLSLTADPDAPGPVSFVYYLDSSSSENPVSVDPGVTLVVPITDLEDGPHTIQVDARELPEDPQVTVLEPTEFQVVCDPAPEGPYTNAKAEIQIPCSPEADVHASNRPIGGNTADLQPVTFVVTATLDGVTKTLAEFTLPDETGDPYAHIATVDLSEYATEDPAAAAEGGYGITFAPATLSVTANGEEIASVEQLAGCYALPSGPGEGPAVVNTGA